MAHKPDAEDAGTSVRRRGCMFVLGKCLQPTATAGVICGAKLAARNGEVIHLKNLRIPLKVLGGKKQKRDGVPMSKSDTHARSALAARMGRTRPKSANAVDARVGQKLKQFRSDAGWSQERLALLVGVAFQQVQKYEKGVNRIGAGRLHQFAALLGVPVDAFFDDGSLASQLPGADTQGVGRDLVRFLQSEVGVALRSAYRRLHVDERRTVVALVEQIASSMSR
jgi:transcriptional regulator with XRE-family HTH domain